MLGAALCLCIQRGPFLFLCKFIPFPETLLMAAFTQLKHGVYQLQDKTALQIGAELSRHRVSLRFSLMISCSQASRTQGIRDIMETDCELDNKEHVSEGRD